MLRRTGSTIIHTLSRPLSRTRIRSQSITELSLWAIVIIEQSENLVRIVSCIKLSVLKGITCTLIFKIRYIRIQVHGFILPIYLGSTFAVASSRITMKFRRRMALARHTSCLWSKMNWGVSYTNEIFAFKMRIFDFLPLTNAEIIPTICHYKVKGGHRFLELNLRYGVYHFYFLLCICTCTV